MCMCACFLGVVGCVCAVRVCGGLKQPVMLVYSGTSKCELPEIGHLEQ